jgi:H+-transporting ATPase
LSAEEAVARLARYGRNTLDGKRHSAVRELPSHFWQPIPWGIEAALVLTALTRRWTDFGVIFALLLLNGLVGFWEEHQPEDAIEALKSAWPSKRACCATRRGGWCRPSSSCRAI